MDEGVGKFLSLSTLQNYMVYRQLGWGPNTSQSTLICWL